ncbi:uncharacterized protein LODBEIA_P01830 [Lodderomyces beijingensis]|uniref:Uncharacterized protein n=1 Tax=Lodderomyces beijingensis TaxID=1775926 RepID=A0ABP0ZDJ1_9ASCO
MSDFAFNNYCIHCDKLCPSNSAYCSDECKIIEYQTSLGSLESRNSTSSSSSLSAAASASHSHHNASNTSTSSLSKPLQSTSDLSLDTSSELVSPLLTPALYLQQQQQLLQQQRRCHSHMDASPFSLQQAEVETTDDYYDLNYFDLNYSVRSNTNYTKETPSTSSNSKQRDLLNSTSHNYRKWLTTAL